jgi:hypothetical protein
MQILESSRPIMKCEHFLILHFQVDISTQKQALGKISKFIAYVCEHGCVACVRVCEKLCMCVRAPARYAFLVCTFEVCEGFNRGFSLLFSVCFSWRIGRNVCCYC